MKNHSIIESQPTNFNPEAKKFCPVTTTINVLSGKWKMQILWELRSGVKRFGQIKDAIDEVTPAVLSKQLQSLTDEGIISRQVFAEVPPKAEYQLTDSGKALIDVICTIETWGVNQSKSVGSLLNNNCLWNEAMP